MRKVSIGLVMLMLSACDKVVVSYGGEESEGSEMEVVEGGVLVECDVIAEGIGADGRQDVGTKGLSADGYELTELWVFECSDAECKVVAKQTSDEEEFGKVKFRTERGERRFAFVVSRGEDPDFSEQSGHLVWGKVKDTFWKAVDVNITDGETVSMSATLTRVVGKMSVEFSDVVPSELKKISTYVDGWYSGMDVRTGEGVGGISQREAADCEMEVDVPAAYVGTKALQVSLWGFSREGGFATGVDFVWRDADGGEIAEKRCEAVPIWKNRVTKVVGKMLENEVSAGVSVDGTWGESYNYDL